MSPRTLSESSKAALRMGATAYTLTLHAEAEADRRRAQRASYRRAACTIAAANALDVWLTFRAISRGHSEGNPIARWMIDHWLIVPAKLVLCLFVLAVAYASADWFASRISEVSVRRIWFVAGVYACVVLVGVLANLQ